MGQVPVERRAGADQDDDIPVPPLHPMQSARNGMEEAGAVLKDIAAALNSQDKRAEEAALLQGTGFSVLLYLARGCDRFDVPLAPTEVGREFIKSMKKLFLAGTGEYRRVGWPSPPTNRILLGMARLDWGGRDSKHLTASSLSIADFPTTRAEDLEAYVPPEDLRPEHRPRDPPTYLSWMRQVKNSIRAFACVYGREHEEERLAALDALCRRHETDDHKYPLDFLRSAWEELAWRWVEELKEELRKCRKILGKEKMRRDELEFVALSPTSAGTAYVVYPNVFDLENPTGYYQRVVEQRLQERAQRALWDAAHARTSGRKNLGWKPENPGGAAGGDHKAGAPKTESKPPSPAAKRAAASAEVRNMYPAGKPLTAEEVAMSREVAPTDSKGRIKCWDVASHKGCTRTAAECFRSHLEPIRQADSMHWTVQAQIIRRGGLKHQQRVEPHEVDQKIQALRDAHQSDEKAKRNEGLERAKGSNLKKKTGGEWSSVREEHAGESQETRRVQWAAPEEYTEAEWTQAEDDLRQWCQGPASDWVQGNSTFEGERQEATPGANLLQQDTYLRYQELSRSEAEPFLKPLPVRLQVICRARLVQEKREFSAGEVEKLLQELTHEPDPELQQEAQAALSRCGASAQPAR
eukprot:3046823-Amphidinium_carterae.1